MGAVFAKKTQSDFVLAEPSILDDVLRKLSFADYELSEEKKKSVGKGGYKVKHR